VKAEAKPIRLIAEDARDLEVVSAMLQDALTSLAEMRFEPSKRRFVAMLNRYARERGEGVRVRSALRVEGVLAARTAGIDQADKRGLLPLLALTAEPGEEGACRITLEFAGGGSIRLEAECVDAALSDVGPSWRTPRRPRHPVDS
jgi:hypothetical protein